MGFVDRMLIRASIVGAVGWILECASKQAHAVLLPWIGKPVGTISNLSLTKKMIAWGDGLLSGGLGIKARGKHGLLR